MTELPKIINDIIAAADKKEAKRILDLICTDNNPSTAKD